LHQHQREAKTIERDGRSFEYIEVTKNDIALANRLAHEVLGRSLDELAPQTRRVLMLLDEMATASCERLSCARSEYRFTRRDVREHTGWGHTQLKVHLARLEELEYVLVHRGRQGQGFVYELVYDGRGRDGAPFVCGLLDVAALQDDPNLAGVSERFTGVGRPAVGVQSGGGRPDALSETRSETAANVTSGASSAENARKGEASRTYVLRRANGSPSSLAAAASES
jgi:hypothetical protein